MLPSFIYPLLQLLLPLLLAPLLLGCIYRGKAYVAGRRGKPLLQLYYDLWRLAHKSAVYPHASNWIFWAGPIGNISCILVAFLLLPFGAQPALLHFTGDAIFIAYLFAAGRFMTILAALDTGSAFEGMGASREATFGSLTEPTFLLCLLPLSLLTKTFSLSSMLDGISIDSWVAYWPTLTLVCIATFLILLTENCRIPVDDPTTHLELTMIHEVMVLDHGGPDLALIEYAAALKLWFFAQLLVGIMLPLQQVSPLVGIVCSLAAIITVTIVVSIVESVIARLRLNQVPKFITLAGTAASLALLMLWWRPYAG